MILCNLAQTHVRTRAHTNTHKKAIQKNQLKFASKAKWCTQERTPAKDESGKEKSKQQTITFFKKIIIFGY